MVTNELIYKTEVKLPIQKSAASYQYLCVCVGMWRGAGMNWGIVNDTHTLVYVKQITSKDLPVTQEPTQYSVMIYM